MKTATTAYNGVHCQMHVEAPAPGVVLVRISGRDIGEFGLRPIQEIERLMEHESVATLFIDARDTTGASVDVSNQWAQWLLQNRGRLGQIHMLVGSGFVRMTAEFVRRFATLGAQMTIHADTAEFDRVLARSLG